VVKLSGDHQNEATWVICRNIKAGRQKEFDDRFEHYLTFERKASGYLGTTVIIPGGSKIKIRTVTESHTKRS
jgi:antibiotic biosynthesis monooxygenase (ABM) superfamily enzyme